MQDDFETFGIPAENIAAAKKWARQQRHRIDYHTKVPTRKEVLTLPVELLTQLIIGWLVHSPIEIIPSRIQVEQVIELLRQRDDAAKLARLISQCQQYVKNQ